MWEAVRGEGSPDRKPQLSLPRPLGSESGDFSGHTTNLNKDPAPHDRRGKMTGSETDAAQTCCRKPLTRTSWQLQPTGGTYKLLCSAAFGDAPGGTWEPIPGHRRRVLPASLRPQPAGGTPPTSSLSPALQTRHSLASPSPPAASPAAATPRGRQRGNAFSKGKALGARVRPCPHPHPREGAPGWARPGAQGSWGSIIPFGRDTTLPIPS